MKTFQSKCVWIIGASSGIGLALAQELAEQGARLILSARRKDALDMLNTDLGGKHHVVPFDASDIVAFEKAAQDAAGWAGRIDSVVLMSALYTPMELAALDIPEVQNILQVNIGGAFNAISAVLPVLRGQGGGQFVLCASVAGYRGIGGGQPYSATKAAIHNLAESLKLEEERHNIDVRVISPGFVKTPMTGKNDFKMPMMIEPEEAARAIAKGLLSSAYEIHFPRRLTWAMKILRILPSCLYFAVMRKI